MGKAEMTVDQTIRSDSSSLSPSNSRRLAEKFADAGRSLALRLARAGRSSEAIEATSALRKDAGAGSPASVSQTGAEHAWTEEYDGKVKKVSELDAHVAKLESQRRSASSDEQKKLEAERDAAQAASFECLKGLMEKSKHVDLAANRLDETPASKELLATLATLPTGSAAVYAIPDEDEIQLIVARPSGLTCKTVAAKGYAKEIESYLAVLQRPDLNPTMLGGKLYDILVRPIEPLLDSKGVTMWCLTGSLRTLPVAALWDGERYAFEKYPMCEFSPAFVKELSEKPSHRPGAIVAGVTGVNSPADPVTGMSVPCSALPGVLGEVRAVCNTLGARPMLDEDFTSGLILQALKSDPGTIHLASHYVYVPGDDRRSFLLTGGNGAWTIEKIKELPEKTLKGVDLITLSACATAEGKSATGDETESFANWMLRKGAGAVLSTLWDVNDESTALLMREFYRIRRAHPEWTKVKALSAAQEELFTGKLAGSSLVATRTRVKRREAGTGKLDAPPWPSDRPMFAHPFYWAPFILTGNWR
jgi:CHAT domain-containing protein